MTSNGQIIFNSTEVELSGYSDYKALNCDYRCFDRREGDDVTIKYDEWKKLTNGTQVLCEFVQVACYKAFPKIRFYTNLHNQIRLQKPKQSEENKPSVLLFVLDSVSHSNWVRNLPKTLNVIKEEYNSYIFKGFTKVGDNSLPNALAFLTGKKLDNIEFPEDMTKQYYDDVPLIWKDFKSHNYTTFYAEDFVDFNLFKYLSNGFKQKPTDHYFRPFWLELYGSFLHRRSSTYCYGQFIEKYSLMNQPTWSLNWLTELGHNYINLINAGDEEFAHFFHELQPQLKDSFVFFFSDHGKKLLLILSFTGSRFGSIRQSLVGRIEDRMPFFSMHAPEWLLKRYPRIDTVLKDNTQRLTSFFDLYITLLDILHLDRTNSWSDLSDEKIHKMKHLNLTRGLSLLRPIPEKRNCENAGIPEEFCVCQEEQPVKTTDTNVHISANKLLSHINHLLKDHKTKCAQLKLKSILMALTFLPNIEIVKNLNSPRELYVNYRVTIEASPSDAIFEAVIQNHIHLKTFTVFGDVNRLNRYGNQSECIQSAFLRKLCYCI